MARGIHLVKPCHSTFVRGIWNNTPIFKKYWKIPPKIIFFNPLPICLADFKKPLFSLYIACIHFFIYIFYTPLYFYLREKKTKHKKGRHLIGALRQITLLGIKMYHMMSKQIREGLFVPISNSSVYHISLYDICCIKKKYFS